MWVMELSLVVRFSTIFSVFMAQINSSDPAVTSHITAPAILHVFGGLMQQQQQKKISLQNINIWYRILLGFFVYWVKL